MPPVITVPLLTNCTEAASYGGGLILSHKLALQQGSRVWGRGSPTLLPGKEVAEHKPSHCAQQRRRSGIKLKVTPPPASAPHCFPQIKGKETWEQK
ncbi:hypothetical protein XENTR_v10015307 [Xenopus tropicalis]|nr:hypothetical protein XENTR_v10015307 [Xenopus tropicalis]